MRSDKYENEKPQQTVSFLDYDYRLAQYLVTNAQFKQFVAAGGYSYKDYWTEAARAEVWRDGKVKGRWDDDFRDKPLDLGLPFNLDNHPVVGLTWYEALAFCRWLTGVSPK